MKMSRQYQYNQKLHIASILNQNDWSKMNVHTLLQCPGEKQPSINAYLGARYSRSADSVSVIAEEVMEKGVNSAEKLEGIFHGYGHKSVGDMADIFLCIENIPMILAMKIFNMNPVIAGQERSTRFQNFKNPEYIKIPESVKVSKILRDKYDQIIQKQMNNYCEMLEPTKEAMARNFKINVNDEKEKKVLEARTFDVVRYFLPLGLETSLGAVMSARNWADFIGYLRGSNQIVDNELGEIIYDLLTGTKELEKQGYVPEADGLIRHTESNKCRLNSFSELVKVIDLDNKNVKAPKKVGEYLKLSKNIDAVVDLLSNILLIENPLATTYNRYPDNVRRRVGEIIFENHDQYKQIGCIGQSGSIQIDSFADQGILKDLNRHRSMERFVPFWNENVNIHNEFEREDDKMFFLCDYLYNFRMSAIEKECRSRLTATYSMIREWKDLAKNELSEENVREFTRYLVPHAHATRYRFYGSVDDLQYTINLRTRNGGHIAYRNHTYQWLQKLARMDSFWKPLLEKLPKVDAKSREQMLDRS